jgi:hypothetical protein
MTPPTTAIEVMALRVRSERAGAIGLMGEAWRTFQTQGNIGLGPEMRMQPC